MILEIQKRGYLKVENENSLGIMNRLILRERKTFVILPLLCSRIESFLAHNKI